jgi:DNA-binding FrmR family transcriptional regulator
MAHTIRDKKKLLNRVRRVRGQIKAVERLLEAEVECSDVLQQIAACRGSINALMAEVLEGHIRCHIAEPKQKPRAKAVEELIGITRSYLK